MYKSDGRGRGSDGGLWLHLQHELVWFWVDVLLADSELRDRLAADHQAEVAVFQLELGAMTQWAGDRCLADECPLQSSPALAVVPQSRTRSQVALQKRLLTKHSTDCALTSSCEVRMYESGSRNYDIRCVRVTFIRSEMAVYVLLINCKKKYSEVLLSF